MIYLPVEIYAELEEKKKLLDENANEINIIFEITNIDLECYKSYYPYLLKLLKEELKVLEIYEDCLRIEDGFLTLIVSNEVEEERLGATLPKINTFYKMLGYKFNIDITIRHEENILEEIKQELEVSAPLPPPPQQKEEKKEEAPKEKQFRREPKDPNSVIGRI